MADDADLANDNHDAFLTDTLSVAGRIRRESLRRPPPCENNLYCGKMAFVTKAGTISRFCPSCWEDFKAGR